MEIKIKKGYDLPIAGAVSDVDVKNPVRVASSRIAIVPDDFEGIVCKVDVHPGDSVAAGTPILHSKTNPAVKIVSPVSGTVEDVVRGERRKILRVVIKVEGDRNTRFVLPSEEAEGGKTPDAYTDATVASAEAWLLAASGLLAMIRQRPYDIVPDPVKAPRDIFVTAFDSAPLAATTVYSSAEKAVFDAAVKFLKRVTKGDIFISRRDSSAIPDVDGAVMVEVSGPHPAGLAGVQAANIRPVNKGEVIWTMDVHTLYKIGQLASNGTVDWTNRVAVTGSCLEHPYVALALPGTEIKALVEKAGLKSEYTGTNALHVRYISGNVLSGFRCSEDSYLRRPYTQVTVIPEGDDKDEFMGWASLSPSLMSMSPSYPGHWLRRIFSPDARIRGGRRAMIMSGIYEKLFPMDVLPEYLLKAIDSGNIDDMEKLGIYEVAPEDFALAEYADSSKLPLQAIVRKGLDMMRKETE